MKLLPLLTTGLLASLGHAQQASYTTFGSGCTGTGGTGCVVLPSAYGTKMGQGANTYPHARADMRYQQVFLGSEIGGPKLFTELSLRLDETYGGPAQAQTIELLLGQTTVDPATISATFAANYGTSPPTSVFKGTLNLPAHTSGGNIDSFAVTMKFTRTYLWVPASGQNLLTEWLNTSASASSHFEDKCQGATDCTTTRVWGFGASSASGSIERNGGLVMCLRALGGGAVPVLTATGVPSIGKSFSVDLSKAVTGSAAGLILGISNTSWGAFPLPLDLSPFGAGGCSLLVSFDALGVFPTSATGTASAPFSIPNQSALLGIVFHNQWLVLDKNANTLGVALSNGGTARIGT